MTCGVNRANCSCSSRGAAADQGRQSVPCASVKDVCIAGCMCIAWPTVAATPPCQRTRSSDSAVSRNACRNRKQQESESREQHLRKHAAGAHWQGRPSSPTAAAPTRGSACRPRPSSPLHACRKARMPSHAGPHPSCVVNQSSHSTLAVEGVKASKMGRGMASRRRAGRWAEAWQAGGRQAAGRGARRAASAAPGAPRMVHLPPATRCPAKPCAPQAHPRPPHPGPIDTNFA